MGVCVFVLLLLVCLFVCFFNTLIFLFFFTSSVLWNGVCCTPYVHRMHGFMCHF